MKGYKHAGRKKVTKEEILRSKLDEFCELYDHLNEVMWFFKNEIEKLEKKLEKYYEEDD